MLALLRQSGIGAIVSFVATVLLLVLAVGCENLRSAKAICDLQFGLACILQE
ncbi:MAG: hypothetical protein ACE5IR_26720 [bacterium]